MLSELTRVWDERMEERREFQTVGTATQSEHISAKNMQIGGIG